MGKQLDFNEKELEIIKNSIMSINEILLLKMDDGVDKPILEGTMEVENEDKIVTFLFVAQKK